MALREIEGGPVLIVLGDTIVDCDLQKFVQAGKYVLGVHQVSDPERFGIVELVDGYVTALEEKPQNPRTDLALIGLYYFSNASGLKQHLRRLVQAGTTTSGEIQLTDALAAMLADGVRFLPYDVPHWYDCGTKETLLATNRFLLDRAEVTQAIDGDGIIPPVSIDPSAVIVASDVGPHVSVGAGARIENSVVSNSIVASGSEVVDANIKDSLVGANAVVKNRRGVVNIGEHSEIDDG
jgi:glucose-1-phosphate thymidylyltransferase